MIDTLYYSLKPLIPRPLQIWLRRRVIRRKLPRVAGKWPIDEASAKPPQGWQGWPGGKRFALVLTHDVETLQGHERCRELAALETELGFRSSFNFVPEKYPVSPELREHLTSSGFEVGVHGLRHDGKYFKSRKIFRERAKIINRYLRDWGATGYRSPSMLHNLEWFHDLNISYDASTFDTDPFEPQPDGTGNIFPFWVENGISGKGYVELPYTLPQDFTLFVLMQHKDIDLWKKKLDWIARHGGMALMIIHPDYLTFEEKTGPEEYPAHYYRDFLQYVKTAYGDTFWNALPKEVAVFSGKSARTTVKQTAVLHPDEEAEWDQFVESQPCGWITHLSGWKHVLERSFPHIRGTLLVLKENGRIRAGLPIYEVKSWLLGKRLVSIPFATRSHPIIQNSEDLKLLFLETLRLGRERNVSHVKIQCVSPEHTLEQFAGTVTSTRFKAHTLQLSAKPQEIFKQFHKKSIRQMVKRAEKSGVSIRSLSGKEDLRRFYDLYSITRRRLGLPPHPEVFIRLLWEQFAPDNQVEGFLAERAGDVIAGLLVFKYCDRVSAEYSGSRNEAHRIGTIPLLYWHAVAEASRQGFKNFDFGRTAEDNTGLMVFKDRWGTSVTSLPSYYCPVNSKKKFVKPSEYIPSSIFKEVIKRTPVPVVESIGKLCYRHLG